MDAAHTATARTQPTDLVGAPEAAAPASEPWREPRPVAFWYRIGTEAPRVIQAADEAAARTAVLDRHPETSDQRVWLEPYRI